MARLSRHGPMIGVYFVKLGTRYALFEDGTVLRNINGTGWRKTALNAQRLLAADPPILKPDTSIAARAMMTRALADSHAHEHVLSIRQHQRAMERSR